VRIPAYDWLKGNGLPDKFSPRLERTEVGTYYFGELGWARINSTSICRTFSRYFPG
jgi:hypothetical protein